MAGSPGLAAYRALAEVAVGTPAAARPGMGSAAGAAHLMGAGPLSLSGTSAGQEAQLGTSLLDLPELPSTSLQEVQAFYGPAVSPAVAVTIQDPAPLQFQLATVHPPKADAPQAVNPGLSLSGNWAPASLAWRPVSSLAAWAGSLGKRIGPTWTRGQPGLWEHSIRLRRTLQVAGQPGPAQGLRVLFDGGRWLGVSPSGVVRPPKADASASGGRSHAEVASPKALSLGAEIRESRPASPVPLPAQSGARPAPLARFLTSTASLLFLGGALVLAGANVVPVAILSASLLASVLLHETAHLWTLRRLGDPSGSSAGRYSLNPLKHIDPVGTVLVPALSLAASASLIGLPVLLGWARPVPVDFNKLGDRKADPAKVALAGPAANLLVAGLALAALAVLSGVGLASAAGTAAFALSALWKTNLALAAFNLLPLPFLDGGKVLVSLLPKKLYDRWIRNPNLPSSYQGLYTRIYQGPSNLLSRLHLRSLERVNGLSRAAMLAALGAFYALTFSVIGFPLLFLALPCSYDYWCIREKVRSEAAVSEMMDLMGEWGSVIAQIAEDLGAESEVSSFEAEHALKNAFEAVLDHLMDQEEFRNLSDEDKIVKVIEAYPNFAVRFLKDKVLSEDSEEMILKILKDGRNEPFYERLRAWMAKHDVFNKWRSPHEKKKLKEGLQEEETKRSRGAGGPANSPRAEFSPNLSPTGFLSSDLPTLPGTFTAGENEKVFVDDREDPSARYATLLRRGWDILAHTLPAAPDGPEPGTASQPELPLPPAAETGRPFGHKIRSDPSNNRNKLRVRMRTPHVLAAEAVLESHGLALEEVDDHEAGAGVLWVSASARDGFTAGQKAAALEREELVLEVKVHPDVARFLRVATVPAPAQAPDPVTLPPRAVSQADGFAEETGFEEQAVGVGAATEPPPTEIQGETAPQAPPIQMAAPEGGAERQVPRDAKGQRDVQAAFIDFLHHRTLSDGKSTLTPAQVKILLRFLRPVRAKPDAPNTPVIARNEELKVALPILVSPRGMRTSVILVGEAGVGKTAVAEGLAQLIEEVEAGRGAGGEGQEASYLNLVRLKGRWIVEFNIDELLSPGEDEDPVQLFKMVMGLLPLLNDPSPQRGNELILLFDEIHKLFLDPAGRKIANYLKTPLRDGRVSILATITEKEYKEYIEPDDAFRRRLELLRIQEPTVDQALQMLRGIRRILEALHDTVLPDETLVSAVKLSHQFDKTNFLPDKAIKLVEDSSELARPDNRRTQAALDIRETWRSLSVAFYEARQALLDKGVPSALALTVELYNAVARLSKQVTQLYAELAGVRNGTSVTTPDIVKRTLAKKTGIETGQLTLGEEDASRYVHMEGEMGRRVIGQDRAILALANAIRRNKAGLSDPNRPMGKFLLVGPTGVGKTYIAKELARFLFKDPNAMIRFDMSEFMEEHTYLRLTGAPPSYVGYEEGGQLTEAVRKRPYSVILFDEIEKAHPKVWNVLLQILEDGRLTDGHGRTVDFKNTVILMSSNIGMAAVDYEKYERLLETETDPLKRREIEDRWDAEIALAIREGIRMNFRPEFLNRLDQDPGSKNQWVLFNRLDREQIVRIARIQLEDFKTLLKDRHDTELEISEEALELLARHGFSPAFGARPMRAAIEKFIIDPLALWILRESEAGRPVKGSLIKVGVAQGTTAFQAVPRPPSEHQRIELEGLAEKLTRAALDLLEASLRLEQPALPDEKDLESLFRKLQAPQPSGPSPGQPSASRSAFFPDTPLQLPDGASKAQAAGNLPNKKDEALREAVRTVLEELSQSGWSDPAKELLTGQLPQGEGWFKLFIRHAKEKAKDALEEEPLILSWKIDDRTIRVLLHRGHEMSGQERAYLSAHFTGAPPDSLQDAQRKADDLNLQSPMVYNHYLWDLYRKLVQLPGARAGYATGSQAQGGRGTDYWIEIERQAANPALTPHQARERAKLNRLLTKMIRQENLKDHEQDGPSVRIAAATAFSWLATPEDAAQLKRQVRGLGWTSEYKKSISDEWPLLMTLSLVLEQFGTVEDIPLLETLSARFTSSSHLHSPAHAALANALAALYRRAGLERARGALASSSEDVKAGARQALGQLGALEDKDALGSDAEALLALLDRLAPEELQAILQKHRRNENTPGPWRNYSTAERILLIKLLSRQSPMPEGDLDLLHRMLHKKVVDDRSMIHAAAEAWKEIVVRDNKTRGLVRALDAFLEKESLTHFNSTDPWGVLLALVRTAGEVGGPDILPALEEIMKQNPSSVQAVHEQAYFETPLAWAKVVVRSGLFAQYSQRIQQMLTSSNSLSTAAALYAIALAQEGPAGTPSGQAPSPAPQISEPSDLPGIYTPGSARRNDPEPMVHPSPERWGGLRGFPPEFGCSGYLDCIRRGNPRWPPMG